MRPPAVAVTAAPEVVVDDITATAVVGEAVTTTDEPAVVVKETNPVFEADTDEAAEVAPDEAALEDELDPEPEPEPEPPVEPPAITAGPGMT